jgi:pimeloyl-ACP methyl ester carboxylesterase
VAWNRVQWEVAKRTRACSWDRPALGFSDPSSAIQTVDNTTRDLEAALFKRGIEGPFVVVGHSLGSYESLLFADRHIDDIAGLVLVDPAIPDQVARRDHVAPDFSATGHMLNRARVMALKRCAVDLRNETIGPDGPDPNGCFTPPPVPPNLPDSARVAIIGRAPTAERFETLASQWSEVDIDGVIVIVPRRNYGDRPLIVLSAGDPESFTASRLDAEIQQYHAFRREFQAGHAEYAALSTHGVHRIVSDTTHNIPIIRPDAVIEAIVEVLDESAKSEER